MLRGNEIPNLNGAVKDRHIGEAISAAHGGTSFSTYTKGDIIWASDANTLAKLGIGLSGKFLSWDGTNVLWETAGGGVSDLSSVLNLTGGSMNAGSVLFANQLTVTGNLRVTGDAYITGNLFVGTNINTTGNTYSKGKIETASSIWLTGGVQATGASYFGAGVFITGSLTTSVNLLTTGYGYFKDKIETASNIWATGNLQLTGSAFINTNLSVSGTAYIKSNITTAGGIWVTGQTHITGGAYFGGGIFVTGSITTNTNALVTGYGYFKDKIETASNIWATGNLQLTGSAYINTNLYVTGTTFSKGNISTAGNLSVTGNIDKGTWTATAIGATKGGTSQTTYALGDILWASAVDTLSKLNVGLSGKFLTWDGLVVKWESTPVGGSPDLSSVLNLTGGSMNVGSTVYTDNLVVTGILRVTGNAYVTGTLYVGTSIENTGTLYSKGNISTAGNLSVTGNIDKGTWTATAIGATKGGTSQTTYALGDLLWASAVDTLSKLNAGTSGQFLTWDGLIVKWSPTPVGGAVDLSSVLNLSGGNMSAGSTIYANDITVTGNLRVTGTLHVTGASYFGTSIETTGTIYAKSNISTAGNLSVTGNIDKGTWTATAIGATKGGTSQTSYTKGDTLWASDTDTLSKLAIGASGEFISWDGTNILWESVPGGAPDLSTVLNLTGGSMTVGSVIFADSLTVTGILRVTGNTYITGSLYVGAGIQNTGAFYSKDKIETAASIWSTGGIQASGASYFAAGIFVTGSITTNTNTLVTGYLYVKDRIETASNIWATGNLQITGSAYINTNVLVTGNIYGKAKLETAGSVWVTGNLQLTGSAYIQTNVYTTGTTFSKGTISSAGDISITGSYTKGTWASATAAIGATYGGTAQSSYAKADMIYASATDTLSKLAAGSTGSQLSMVGGIPTWSDSKVIRFNSLTGDSMWAGTVVDFGGSVTYGLPVYVSSTHSGTAANASATTTMPAIGLSVGAGGVLIHGLMRYDTWNWATVGGEVYVAGGGGLTQTVPTSSGTTVQIVGIAASADMIFVMPMSYVIRSS